MPKEFDERSEKAEEIRRWSAHLDDLYAAWKYTINQPEREKHNQSGASEEDEYIVNYYPNWGENEASDAASAAVQVSDAAAHHAAGLSALIRKYILAIAPLGPIRSVVEHVAHAAWILDPTIYPENRIARMWLAEYDGCSYYKKAAKNRKSKPEEKNADAIRKDIEGQIKSRFADFKRNNEGKLTIVTQRGEEIFPTLSKRNDILQRVLRKHGSASEGLYDALSFFVHPNPVALSMIVRPYKVDGRTEYHYDETFEQWAQGAYIVSELLYLSGSMICEYFGLTSKYFDKCAAIHRFPEHDS